MNSADLRHLHEIVSSVRCKGFIFLVPVGRQYPHKAAEGPRVVVFLGASTTLLVIRRKDLYLRQAHETLRSQSPCLAGRWWRITCRWILWRVWMGHSYVCGISQRALNVRKVRADNNWNSASINSRLFDVFINRFLVFDRAMCVGVAYEAIIARVVLWLDKQLPNGALNSACCIGYWTYGSDIGELNI